MNNQDLYFKNEASKYMFALTEVGGKIQLNLLGVDYNHYRNENLAKNWYQHIKQIIEDSEFTLGFPLEHNRNSIPDIKRISEMQPIRVLKGNVWDIYE